MHEAMLAARKKTLGGGPDPYWDKVVLLMRMDSNFLDSGPKGKTTSFIGSISFVDGAFPKSKAITIADSTHGLSVLDNGDFSWAAGTDYTIEAWIYTTDVKAYKQIVGQWGGPNAWQLALYSENLGWVRPDGTWQAGAPVPLNTWQHVAWCREGTTSRLFRHGKVISTYTDNYNYPFDASSALGIGRAYPQNGYSFTGGAIDEVRITKGVARYKEDFDPYVGPF